LPIYFWIQPSIKPAGALEQKQESLLKLGSGIDAITVAAGPESLRFQKDKDGKFYDVVAPPGKFIPHDLMDAMVSLLTNAKSVEVVADDSTDLAQFGLDHPKSVITIEPPASRSRSKSRSATRTRPTQRSTRRSKHPESVLTRPEYRVLPISDVPVDRGQARQERVAPSAVALVTLKRGGRVPDPGFYGLRPSE